MRRANVVLNTNTWSSLAKRGSTRQRSHFSEATVIATASLRPASEDLPTNWGALIALRTPSPFRTTRSTAKMMRYTGCAQGAVNSAILSLTSAAGHVSFTTFAGVMRTFHASLVVSENSPRHAGITSTPGVPRPTSASHCQARNGNQLAGLHRQPAFRHTPAIPAKGFI